MGEVIEAVKLKKYPAYKESGVEWLGEIPEHWVLERLGQILSSTSSKNHPKLPLLSITRERAVILRDLDDEEENHNYIPDDLSNYKLLKKGQFGMNKMKAWQGSYGVSPYTGIVSPAYYTFDLKEALHPDFFHIAIRSRLYISFFGSASDGVRIGQWDLSRSRMKNIPFLIPPVEEQILISQFLDRKTTQIDQAIDIKQKQIELLKERRQILIHQAVTRGLDPNVRMKDSGVEWIGEIPEGWEVVANKTIFTERNQPGNASLPILTVSIHTAVSSEELDGEENLRGKIRIEDKSAYKLVKINDIVLNMMRAWQGAIGAVRTNGMVSPAYIVAQPKGYFNAGYFEYQYRTNAFIQQMDRSSKGITDFRKRLYWNEFKQLKTILPPITEQQAIVTFIEISDQKIATAISLKEKEIEKLKEYKATLINSAVTGKIRIY